MVTESVSESTYRPNYFPLPPSLIPTSHDEVLDNLIAALEATISSPWSPMLAALAKDTLRRVRNIQRASQLAVIIDHVEREFRLQPGTLQSRVRTQHVAYARQVAMFLCRRLTTKSLPQIGAAFGRDHSTTHYACELISRRFNADPPFRKFIEKLDAEITLAPTKEAAA
jgi:chromosomal replication initiation ATPase DnaA